MNSESSTELAVSLSYSCNTSVSPNSREPDGFLLSVSAEIVGTDWGKENASSTEVTLGNLKFFLVKVGNALESGIGLFSIFDLFQQTMDAGSVLFDDGFTELNDEVREMFPDAFEWDDIMLIDRLEIDPGARGQNLGLAVLISAIEDWSSGCSLVIMKPFPLQFESDAQNSNGWGKLELANFPQDEDKATRQLRAYYERIGFKQIGSSDFYAVCVKEKWCQKENLEIPAAFTFKAS